jgi:hypothetical protein
MGAGGMDSEAADSFFITHSTQPALHAVITVFV